MAEHEAAQWEPTWMCRVAAAIALMAVVAASSLLLMFGMELKLGPFMFVGPVLLCYVAVEPLCNFRENLSRGALHPSRRKAQRTANCEAEEKLGAAPRQALVAQIEGAERCRTALEASDALLAELRSLLESTHEATHEHAHAQAVLAEMAALTAQQRRQLSDEVDAIESGRRRLEVAGLQNRFVTLTCEAKRELRDIAQTRAACADEVEAATGEVQDGLCRVLVEGEVSRTTLGSGSLYGEAWSRRIAALRTGGADA